MAAATLVILQGISSRGGAEQLNRRRGNAPSGIPHLPLDFLGDQHAKQAVSRRLSQSGLLHERGRAMSCVASGSRADREEGQLLSIGETDSAATVFGMPLCRKTRRRDPT